MSRQLGGDVAAAGGMSLQLGLMWQQLGGNAWQLGWNVVAAGVNVAAGVKMRTQYRVYRGKKTKIMKFNNLIYFQIVRLRLTLMLAYRRMLCCTAGPYSSYTPGLPDHLCIIQYSTLHFLYTSLIVHAPSPLT